MTGAELHETLVAAARERGLGVCRFIAPLSGNPATFLEQLKQAKCPKERTVARIHALLEGREIPPGQAPIPGVVTCTRAEREARGLPPSARMRREETSIARTLTQKARVEQTRRLVEMAHASRKPGQTVADRVRELCREVVA